MVWVQPARKRVLVVVSQSAGGDDAGGVDALSAKMVEERAAAGIGSDHADGKDARAEIGKVVDGVGSATRIGFGATVAQNQHRGFARDA